MINKEHVSIRVICTSCRVCDRGVDKSCFFLFCSSLDLTELAKAAKKKLQSVGVFCRTTLFTSRFSALPKCHWLVFTQLSNHLFEELAMDVYDEVDRRETDAGRDNSLLLNICLTSARLVLIFSCFFYSVVGNTEPQHPGDRDDRGAFPSRQPRVFIHTQPGTSALTQPLPPTWLTRRLF